MYPGNVLILDTAIAPCPDAPSSRMASPYAACARPGTFPRSTAIQRLPAPGRGGSLCPPFFPELLPSVGIHHVLGAFREWALFPHAVHLGTRAGTGTRPYPDFPITPSKSEGSLLPVIPSEVEGSLTLVSPNDPPTPNDPPFLGNPRTQRGVLAQGFDLGIRIARTPSASLCTTSGGAP